MKKALILLNACLFFSCAAFAALPGVKQDSRKPIEVTADTLEVLQKENKAIFSGHVVAIQGGIRLKADKMTVHYRQSQDQETLAPVGGQDGIRRIEADSNVFLSTPEETASGAKGVYDVENRKIHLTGNVVLTREKNVLKGDQLTYNFDTAQSVLSGGVTSSASDTKSQGRVRALFVPEDKKKASPKP